MGSKKRSWFKKNGLKAQVNEENRLGSPACLPGRPPRRHYPSTVKGRSDVLRGGQSGETDAGPQPFLFIHLDIKSVLLKQAHFVDHHKFLIWRQF